MTTVDSVHLVRSIHVLAGGALAEGACGWGVSGASPRAADGAVLCTA